MVNEYLLRNVAVATSCLTSHCDKVTVSDNNASARYTCIWTRSKPQLDISIGLYAMLPAGSIMHR